MNVLNRKMFANRDARRKLANMGGIVASSAETLDVAQAYAPGGQVNSDRYVAVIPGINGGRPVSLSADTLARLQQSAPEVMAQSFIMDAGTAAERGVDVSRLRPADSFVERQLSPASAAPAAPVQDDRTVRDVVREGLASSYSTSPGEAISSYLQSDNFNQLSDAASNRPGLTMPSLTTPDDQNPMVSLVESGLNSLRPTIETPAPVTAAGRNLDADLGIGFDPFRTPTVSGQIANDTSGIMATRPEPPVTEETPSIEDAQTMFEVITQNPLIRGAPGVEEEVFDMLTEKREDLNVPGTDIPSDSVKATELDEAIASGSTDPNVIAAAERLQMTGMPDINVKPEMPPEFEEKDKPKNRPGLAEEQAGRGDLSTTVEEIVTNPDATPGEKNDQTAKTVISGLTGTDTSNMDTKELVNYYKDLFSEMLGESDEDKAEEKWLNMAMIGFAIASGESPSALQNIAGGLLEGTSMMMDQRAEDRKREDTITTLAIEQALGREKEDRELERLLAKEGRADDRELQLYIDKLIAKNKFDPDVSSYLGTDNGKTALRIYTDILKDAYIDQEDKLTTFKERAGNLAPEFITKLDLENAGGAETIVQNRTLDDIPD